MRRELWILALNGALIANFALLRGSAVYPFPTVLGIGLMLLIPSGLALVDITKRSPLNTGLYVGLIGTAVLWLPIYIREISNVHAIPDPLIGPVSIAGVILIFASAFLPARLR